MLIYGEIYWKRLHGRDIRAIASKSITVEFNIKLMYCRGEPWLAHEIGCIIVGDSQNRPYITSFFGIFTDKSRCWRSLSQGCVYAPYATLGVYVVNKI